MYVYACMHIFELYSTILISSELWDVHAVQYTSCTMLQYLGSVLRKSFAPLQTLRGCLNLQEFAAAGFRLRQRSALDPFRHLVYSASTYHIAKLRASEEEV